MPLSLTSERLLEEYQRVVKAISPGTPGVTDLSPERALALGGDAAEVSNIKDELGKSNCIKLWAFHNACSIEDMKIPGKLDLMLSLLSISLVIGYQAGRRAALDEQELERLMRLDA